MRVQISSFLPAPLPVCWYLLKQTSTLPAVARGVMTYAGADELPEEWTVGITTNLLPRLYGKPQGDHFVTVTEVCEEEARIVTNEHGGAITMWNHTMQLELIDQTRCRYIDTIDISAGFMTVPVWLFAQFFYRHRHKMWRTLL